MKHVRKHLLLVLVLALCCCIALVACEPKITVHTVTYKDGQTTLTTLEVPDGKKAIPYAAEKDNHTLDGYFTDEALTSAYSFDTPVTADLTLYARFTEDAATPPPPEDVEKVTVTFNGLNGELLQTKEVYKGADLIVTEDIAPEGIPFWQRLAGWQDKDGNVVDFRSITEDISVSPILELNPTDDSYFKFALNDDGASYAICAPSVSANMPQYLVLPEEHNGMPVNAFGVRSQDDTSAFSGARGCRYLYIPGSYETIPSATFYNMDDLKVIVMGEGVKEIGSRAFTKFESNWTPSTGVPVESITIPDSVEKIGYSLSNSFPEIILGEHSHFKYENHAIYSADGKTLVWVSRDVTRFTIDANITSMNNCLFLRNEILISVTIAANLEELPFSTFSGCTALETVNITGVIKRLPDGGCYNMGFGEEPTPDKALKDYDTAYGLHADDYASPFAGCTSLKSLSFPAGLEYIGTAAFQELLNLESVTLPSTVKYIAPSAFDTSGHDEETWQLVSSLRKIKIENATSSSAYYTDSDVCLIERGTGYNGGDTLLKYADACNLTSYTVPDGVTGFTLKSFYFANNLVSVTLPDDIELLYGAPFEACKNLTTIHFPDSLKRIRASWFCDRDMSPDLTYIFGKTNYQYMSVATPFVSSCDSLAEIDLSNCTQLEEIDYLAFRYVYPTSIKLPGSIKKMGSRPFGYLTLIENFVMPDNEYFTYDENNKMVLSADGTVLLLCYGEGEITLPDSVKEIAPYAFDSAINVTAVTLPQGLEIIGEAAFTSCINLRAINIPSTVTEIGDEAFNYILLSDITDILNITFEGTKVPSFGKPCFGFYGQGKMNIVVPKEAYKNYYYALSGAGISDYITAEGLQKTTFNFVNTLGENPESITATNLTAPVIPISNDQSKYFAGWWTKDGSSDGDWGESIGYPYFYEGEGNSVTLYGQWSDEKVRDGSCAEMALEVDKYGIMLFGINNCTIWFRYTNFTDDDQFSYDLYFLCQKSNYITGIRIWFDEGYGEGLQLYDWGLPMLMPGQTVYFEVFFGGIEEDETFDAFFVVFNPYEIQTYYASVEEAKKKYGID